MEKNNEASATLGRDKVSSRKQCCVLGTRAALGSEALSWSNNGVAKHLWGPCVTALVRGAFDSCIGEGPSLPLLPLLPGWLWGEIGPFVLRPLVATPCIWVDVAGIGN